MASNSFLLLGSLAALVLGIMAGMFGVWCGVRFGEGEKRYCIQAIPVLVATFLFAYIDWKHRLFWTLGVFNVVYLFVPRLWRLVFRGPQKGA